MNIEAVVNNGGLAIQPIQELANGLYILNLVSASSNINITLVKQ
jgi:hypothetical protein